MVLISAALGALLGLLVYPAPQYTLEAAQVIGGVVDLPRDDPMRIFDTSAYSLFSIQAPALLLAAGFSESALSLLLSALQGAAAFSAVALVSLAVSRSPVVAVLTPLLLLHIVPFPLEGHKYPVYFPTDPNNGGLLGFYAAPAAISLIALRKERSGSLLLGSLPAFNPVLGVAGWLAAAAALLAERRRYLGLLRRRWPYLAAGAGLFAVTFAVQMLAIRDVPDGIPMEQATDLTTEFLRWDDHRKPFFETGFRTPWEFFEVDAAFVLLAILLLTAFRRSVPSSARLLLIGLLAISAVATAFTVVDEISPGFFPVSVKALLITRWLNWNSIAFPVVAISLLGYLALERRSIIGLVGLALVAVPARAALVAAGLVALLAYALVPPIRRGLDPVLGYSYGPGGARVVASLTVLASATLLIASILDSQRFDLHEESPIWKEAHQGDGLIMVGPVTNSRPLVLFPQLRSRRGILLDPGRLDVVPYAPAAAPGMEEILNDVYGTSLSEPESAETYARTQQLWESRTVKGWQALGTEYGATEVLADSSWDIKLPEKVVGEGAERYHSRWDPELPERRSFAEPVALYRIPNAPR